MLLPYSGFPVGAKHERDYLWDSGKRLHPLMQRLSPKRYPQPNNLPPKEGVGCKPPHQFANNIVIYQQGTEDKQDH
jgi:hypothetical protein